MAHAGPAPVAIGTIRSMSAAEAAEKRAVTVRGIVTALSGWKDSFFLQDDTAGISVDRLKPGSEVHPGDKIVVTGFTGPGSFAPILLADNIRILGSAKRPPARVFRPHEMTYGSQDAQWLALTGLVQTAEVRSIWGRDVLVAQLDIGDGTIVSVRIHDYDPTDPARLSGARITVAGVCGTVFNDQRQFLGLRLFVASSKDVHIDQPAPDDPFREALPRNIGELFKFKQSSSPVGIIKTTGVVTWIKGKRGFFMQDGTHGVFVRTRQKKTFVAGASVDVVGSPAMENGSPVLHAIGMRLSADTRRVQPVAVSGGQLLTEHDGFASAPYASALVSVPGKLIEGVTGVTEDTLLLQSGEMLFSAKVPHSAAGSHWELGSQLQLTGVCEAISDDTHEPTSVQVDVQTPEDVLLLKKAPWWTASHALWIVFMLLLVIVVMLAWNGFLRWQTTLKAQATSDPLTGLYNRRSFMLLAQKQRELAQHNGKNFQMVFIDVDRFKELNDCFGHREGDNTLRAIADMLRDLFRKADVVGRLGGDEFAVATSGPSGDWIRTRVEKALNAMNAVEGKLCAISLSIGVLDCDAQMLTASMEELLERADLLMYEQKRATKAYDTKMYQRGLPDNSFHTYMAAPATV